MAVDEEHQRWREVYVDAENHRRLYFNASTGGYMNFKEQGIDRIDEDKARRLFPWAFDVGDV